MYFNISNVQETATVYLLSSAYKETDLPDMYETHEHLCSMRNIHIRENVFCPTDVQYILWQLPYVSK